MHDTHVVLALSVAVATGLTPIATAFEREEMSELERHVVAYRAAAGNDYMNGALNVRVDPTTILLEHTIGLPMRFIPHEYVVVGGPVRAVNIVGDVPFPITGDVSPVASVEVVPGAATAYNGYGHVIVGSSPGWSSLEAVRIDGRFASVLGGFGFGGF